MIPVRIALEGFMSYRDPVELVFDSAPIWMLSGDNGSGKSAIFDAMTFALYGVHRNGKQQADALINQRSNHLKVEFDLLIGADCYRVRRTLTRNSRGSYQVLHLYGPHHTSGRAEPVPETDSKTGLDQWVKQQIGMDDQGFLMSVLLQQGRSDALLSSKPTDRHELLTQLVDLSRYQQLYERAEANHKGAEQDAQQCARQLEQERQKEPSADEQTIAELAKAKHQADEAVKHINQRLEDLIALKIHAEHWSAHTRERTGLDHELQRMRSLMDNASTIDHEARRQAELQSVLPSLQRIVNERQQLAGTLDEEKQHKQKSKQLSEELQGSLACHNQADAHFRELQHQQQEAQQQHNQATQYLLDLASDMHQIMLLDTYRTKLRQLDARLAEFPAELDARHQQMQRDLEAVEATRDALPHLQALDRARQSWHAARKSTTTITSERERLLTEQQVLTDLLNTDKHTLEEFTKKSNTRSTEHTLAQDRHTHVLQNLKRFQSVANAPACTYCGQPLTEAHLAQERQRLNQELETRKRELEEVAQQYAQAQQDQMQMQRQCNDRTNQQKQLDQQMNHLDEELRNAARQRQQAETEVRRVLDKLPRDFAERLPLATAVGVETVLEAEYPTTAELAELEHQATRIAGLKKSQQTLNKQLSERDHTQQMQAEQLKLVSEAERSYPSERIEALIAKHQSATKEQQQAQEQIDNLKQPVKTAQDQLDKLIQEVEAIKMELGNIIGQEQQAKTRATMLQSSLGTTIQALPEAWRAEAATCTTDRLDGWTSELQTLSGAADRALALSKARATHQNCEQQLRKLDQQLQSIPEAARRPPSELEQQVQTTRLEQYAAQQQAQKDDRAHKELVERYKRIQQLAADQRKAEHTASLWKKLARLLGRDQLQRHLLHQAESSIVAHANDMLDRCSAGTLRLELQTSEEGSAPRAFDLIAYNSATGDQPLAAWLLSGSQRFRVAVSLALGIGQYASQHNRRLETVIIDEGFGSLDRQGRQDMIEALRDLSDTLSRIILVSHQDEFARAFPNRYRIWLQDGCSQVRPSDEEDQ